MKLRIGGAILGVLILPGLSSGVLATMKENPYDSIVARNPFGLRPIPPPKAPEVEPTPVAPLSRIKLLGITTLLATTKALFQYEDWQTKKVEFPSPLSEGETYKTFSVLGIDVENQRVLVRNGGTETMLDFVNHGVKGAVDAPPAPGRLFLPAHPGPIPNSFASNTNSHVLVVGGRPTPSSSSASTPAPPVMTREEAEALIEIARKKFQMQEQTGEAQQGQPRSGIFPPTRVGSALNQPSASPSR